MWWQLKERLRLEQKRSVGNTSRDNKKETNKTNRKNDDVEDKDIKPYE